MFNLQTCERRRTQKTQSEITLRASVNRVGSFRVPEITDTLINIILMLYLFFSAANMLSTPSSTHSSIPNKLLPFYVYELRLTSASVQKFFSRPETCLTTRCKRNTPLIWIDWFSCELRKLGAEYEQPQMGRNAVDEGKKTIGYSDKSTNKKLIK